MCLLSFSLVNVIFEVWSLHLSILCHFFRLVSFHPFFSPSFFFSLSILLLNCLSSGCCYSFGYSLDNYVVYEFLSYFPLMLFQFFLLQLTLADWENQLICIGRFNLVKVIIGRKCNDLSASTLVTLKINSWNAVIKIKILEVFKCLVNYKRLYCIIFNYQTKHMIFSNNITFSLIFTNISLK